MELHLKIIGFILIALAIVHINFPRYFDWKNNLDTVSLINRQMMNVHTLFIGLTVLLMGILCITSSAELVETSLGKKICFGLGIFWTTRLIIQFLGYSSKLWRGKFFETAIHILFVCLWTYLSFVFWKIVLI